MQDDRSDYVPYERAQQVEAAILALLLAEDWPWRVSELVERLDCLPELVRICVARLRADGLVRDEVARDGSGRIRAAWAAVRCDELLRCCPDRTNVEWRQPNGGAARLLKCRHTDGDSAPKLPSARAVRRLFRVR